jgi:tripartite ATP-independent transporter DctM subunit
MSMPAVHGAAAGLAPATVRTLRLNACEAGIARLCATLAAIALIGDFVLVTVSVLSRHIANLPLLWADEVAGMLLMAMAFLGAAAGFSRREHPGLQALRERLPATVRRVLEPAESALVLALSLALATLAMQYITVIGTQTTATGLSQALYVYPLLAGTLAMAVLAALRLATDDKRSVALGIALMVAAALVVATLWKVAPTLTPSPLATLILAFTACLVLGVPIAFALLAGSLAFLLAEGNLPLPVFAQQAVAGIENFVLLSIPFFILTGVVMELNGMSERIIRLIRRVVGRSRPGLGISTIVSMVLFSGVSGSKAADVTAVGTVILPAMRRSGQSAAEGTALLAASAVMAETIPPCINLIILGYVCSISIGALFVGGLLPALFMAVALVGVVLYCARSWPMPVDEPQANAAGTPWLHGLASLGVIAIIFVGYKSGFATATEIGVFATLYALAVGVLLTRKWDPHTLWRSFARSSAMAGSILFVISAAQTVAFSLTVDRIPQAIAEQLLALSPSIGVMGFIALSIGLLIVMGAALEGAPALIIFGPILMPVAQGFGIDPVQYGLVLIIAMGIGLFSPPLGIGLYISCAVGGVRLEEASPPIFKYLAALLLCLLVIGAVPAISLWLPRALGL